MRSLTLDNITMEDLNKRINDLRDILNEICCTEQNTEVQDKRLITSRNLDDLIVKYMKKIKTRVKRINLHRGINMDVFLARQPILDRYNKLFGYELLFRDSEKNIYQSDDGDKATIAVIRNSFVNIGIDKVTGGKKAFINFTENILKSDIFEVLPPQVSDN